MKLTPALRSRGSRLMTNSPFAEPVSRPYLIGVTGNIACGKSTVTDQLAHLGVTVIDADLAYHDLIKPGMPLWGRLIERYGNSIALADGRIDRQALGRIVFSDSDALKELEQLTHPAIRVEVMQRAHNATTPVVAVSAIKLIEGGWRDLCDAIWLVTCSENVQRRRLIRNRGLSIQEAENRLASQPPVEAKREIADVVIDNSGTLDETAAQVDKAWSELQQQLRTVSAQLGSHQNASA